MRFEPGDRVIASLTSYNDVLGTVIYNSYLPRRVYVLVDTFEDLGVVPFKKSALQKLGDHYAI